MGDSISVTHQLLFSVNHRTLITIRTMYLYGKKEASKNRKVDTWYLPAGGPWFEHILAWWVCDSIKCDSSAVIFHNTPQIQCIRGKKAKTEKLIPGTSPQVLAVVRGLFEHNLVWWARIL